jgi:hypothetical protein
MPGSVVFRPIEARLAHDSEWIGKMDPYCTVIVGDKRIKGEVCKDGGVNPKWNDSIAIPFGLQPTCVVELRDKNTILPDATIGAFVVNLDEVAVAGQVSKWYPVFHNNKPAGEILVESTYSTATPVYSRTGVVKDELVYQDHGATLAQMAQTGLASGGGMAGTIPYQGGYSQNAQLGNQSNLGPTGLASQGMAGSIPQGIAGNIPQGMAGSIPQGMTGNIPNQGYSEATPLDAKPNYGQQLFQGTNSLSQPVPTGGIASFPSNLGPQNSGVIPPNVTGSGAISSAYDYKTSITGEIKSKIMDREMKQATGEFIAPPTHQLNEGLYGTRARKHSDNPNVVKTHLPGGGERPL